LYPFHDNDVPPLFRFRSSSSFWVGRQFG